MATNTNPFYTYSATAGSSKTLQKPQDGGDNNQWGNYINTDLDEIVAAVNALSDKIADANEKTLVDFTATGSAVNHIGITNAATGNPPQISSAGSDTNVDLTLTAKGTGDINLTPGTNGDVNIPASKGITFGDDGEKIEGDGTDLTIASSGEINVNSGTLDLSAQTVDVTLNNAVDALNFDSNTLSIDASNNQIGIGTAAPNAKLTSATSKDATALAIVNTTATALGTEKNYLSFYGTNNSGNLIATPLAQIGAQSNNGSYQQGDLIFYTSPFNSSSTERMRISSTGNVTVSDGDLVIGGAGHGIDFSNATDTGTGETVSSSVLDDYEEGYWTITLENGTIDTASSIGKYIKIGKQVRVYGQFKISSADDTGNGVVINNLPFTSATNITNNANNTPGPVRLLNVMITGSTQGGCFTLNPNNTDELQFLSNRDNTTNVIVYITQDGFYGFNHTYEVA